MKLNLKILENMEDELARSPSVYRSSNFWKRLNVLHLKELNRKGLNNFKRTINFFYFNWGILGIIRHQFHLVIGGLLSGNFRPFTNSSYEKFRCLLTSWVNCIFTAYLYDYVLKIDKLEILKKLEEPLIGSPPLINYKKRRISQDICNSVFEFYSIFDNVPIKDEMKIMEIGAGYGRSAYVIHKTLPKTSYCIVDIPPALYIAQEYLKEVFPGEKIFTFRHFDRYDKVKRDFETSRIQFLTPNQLRLLPAKCFDLVINISSLHEMTTRQIKYYLLKIDRFCRGYFYSKQWQKSRTKDNNYIRWHEYPVPDKWKVVYNRKHQIQRMFFESLYKI